jgi:hypothetical protein
MATSSLQVVAVSDLPWPCGPFKCAFEDRFEKLALGIAPEDDERRSFLFGEMVTELSQKELQRCPYHQIDWEAAAEAAIEAWEKGVRWSDPRFSAITDKYEAEWEASFSFFAYPILWHPRQITVDNGQHRICALKRSGAKRCLVEP